MDPGKSGEAKEPQSWNRYTYALGNPLRWVDPDGKAAACPPGGCSPPPKTFTEKLLKGIDQASILPGPGVILMGGRAGGGVLARIGNFLLSKVLGRGNEVRGAFGVVARSTLEAAAASKGAATTVLTKLSSSPELGRGLSTATGEGAEALAGAAREGGKLFQAKIPNALLEQLEKAGLATRSTTTMGGQTATEIRFHPNAIEFILRFFREVK